MVLQLHADPEMTHALVVLRAPGPSSRGAIDPWSAELVGEEIVKLLLTPRWHAGWTELATPRRTAARSEALRLDRVAARLELSKLRKFYGPQVWKVGPYIAEAE